MNLNEISHTFTSDDRRAVDVLERKRADLAQARALSPALVATLETEITTCEAALVKARAAGHEYDREVVEVARAEARRRTALSLLNTSVEVDPDAAAKIVQDAALAQYLEGARKRRAQAARDTATSTYSRVCKDISDRNAAVQFAETPRRCCRRS